MINVKTVIKTDGKMHGKMKAFSEKSKKAKKIAEASILASLLLENFSVKNNQ